MFETPDLSEAIAVLIYKSHREDVHPQAAPTRSTSSKKTPSIERPKIAAGGTEESWSMFIQKWTIFKSGSNIPTEQLHHQLFQCCDESLGEDLLRGFPAVTGPDVNETKLLAAIKELAVTPVAIGVRRTELLNMSQDREEPIRSFHAKVKGKALTCSYKVKCPCDQPVEVDYTENVIKDVILNGLSDKDIKKEVLGMQDIDTLSISDTINRIETKETARNALTTGTKAAAISTMKREASRSATEQKKLSMKIKCADCETQINAFVRIKTDQIRGRKYCSTCFTKSHRSNREPKTPNNLKEDTHTDSKHTDTTSALLHIGSISSSTTDQFIKVTNSRTRKNQTGKAVILDHHLFNPRSEIWRKGRSQPQPTIQLRVTTSEIDYTTFGLPQPKVSPSYLDCVADTGAQ